jgi:hypothetical protein
MVREYILFRMTCLMTDALRSVRRPRNLQEALLVPNQGDDEANENNDGGLPGEFDGDEPDGDLLIRVQGSKGSVPATNRPSRTLPNAPEGLERETTQASAARNTEQVGRLASFS